MSLVSERLSDDISLKLHLPAGCNKITLFDLVNFNSNTTLTGKDAVFCGKCRLRTSQQQSRTFKPDLLIMEVVRARAHGNNFWSKNTSSISFPITDVKLPGFSRSYRVVGTCHHRGTVNSGHWITKVLTNGGWHELDDLVGKSLVTSPPGVSDDSVTIILLIAEDKLHV